PPPHTEQSVSRDPTRLRCDSPTHRHPQATNPQGRGAFWSGRSQLSQIVLDCPRFAVERHVGSVPDGVKGPGGVALRRPEQAVPGCPSHFIVSGVSPCGRCPPCSHFCPRAVSLLPVSRQPQAATRSWGCDWLGLSGVEPPASSLAVSAAEAAR